MIEGASDGAGLGHDFLAHVERTRLLVHVLDLAPLDGSDPETNFEVIERELAEHDPRLASLPRLLALSKADLVTPEVAAEAAARVARAGRVPGDRHVERDLDRVERAARRAARARAGRAAGVRRVAGEDDVAEFAVFRPVKGRPSFDITRGPAGEWIVTGEAVERLFMRWDMENEEARRSSSSGCAGWA